MINSKESKSYEEFLDSQARQAIFKIRHLKKYYPVSENTILFSKIVGYVKAVDDVSFNLYPGETLGLVGESGCGKSTLARTLVKLEQAQNGQVLFEDKDVLKLTTKSAELDFRRNIQLVFQDPYASLNPRRLVMDIIREPLDIHRKDLSKKERELMVLELLKKVGLEEYHAVRYPHEFSGGQRQRIGIARALILRPKIIILDEPVSALDVSVQASILNLLHDLQQEFDLTFLFIAHDLSVVKHVSERVAIMYLGKIMEIGPTEIVFNNPSHPYTVSLLSAIPIPDPDIEKKRIVLQGDVPSPINLPGGCRFHPRCYKATDYCSIVEPELREIEPNVFVACHYPEKNIDIIKFIGLEVKEE